MKQIKIFLLIFAIIFLGIQALSGQTDAIKSGRYYYLTVDGDTIAQKFTIESKAVLYGSYLHELYYPNALVEMLTPNSRFSGKPVSKIVIDSLQDEVTRLKLALENYVSPTLSWVDNENDTYTYNALVDSQYLVFPTCETLTIGDTYDLSFDIESSSVKKPLISFWFYSELSTSLNGVIADDTVYETGAHNITVTIDSYNRDSVGIKPRNEGTFTISNINFKKQ